MTRQFSKFSGGLIEVFGVVKAYDITWLNVYRGKPDASWSLPLRRVLWLVCLRISVYVSIIYTSIRNLLSPTVPTATFLVAVSLHNLQVCSSGKRWASHYWCYLPWFSVSVCVKSWLGGFYLPIPAYWYADKLFCMQHTKMVAHTIQ